jgi:hypothetical protein
MENSGTVSELQKSRPFLFSASLSASRARSGYGDRRRASPAICEIIGRCQCLPSHGDLLLTLSTLPNISIASFIIVVVFFVRLVLLSNEEEEEPDTSSWFKKRDETSSLLPPSFFFFFFLYF